MSAAARLTDFCPGCGLLLGFDPNALGPFICPGRLRVLAPDVDPRWHGAGSVYLAVSVRHAWLAAVMTPQGRVR